MVFVDYQQQQQQHKDKDKGDNKGNHGSKMSTSSTASTSTTGSTQLPSGSGSANPARVQQVVDRLRQDCTLFIQNKKQERLIHLKLGPSTTDTNSASSASAGTLQTDLTEFTERIVDLLHRSLTQTITALVEELRVLEPQRHVPGFQFSAYFLLKERLALTLERVGILEEALTVFDEVEAVFFQCIDAALQKGMCMFMCRLGVL